MRTYGYINKVGKVIRLAHRDEDSGTIWDHAPGKPTKGYKIGATKSCPVCDRKANRGAKHPLDDEARRLIAEGAPAQAFEALRKQGWREWSAREKRW